MKTIIKIYKTFKIDLDPLLKSKLQKGKGYLDLIKLNSVKLK